MFIVNFSMWIFQVEEWLCSFSKAFLHFRRIFLDIFCIFQDRVSPRGPDCPKTCWNNQRSGWPQAQTSNCLCLTSAGIKGFYYHHLAWKVFFSWFTQPILNSVKISILFWFPFSHLMKQAGSVSQLLNLFTIYINKPEYFQWKGWYHLIGIK